MALRWQAVPEGDALPSLGGEFASQTQAEAWLSANYVELAEAGVSAVTLWDETTVVYGPMSLAE